MRSLCSFIAILFLLNQLDALENSQNEESEKNSHLGQLILNLHFHEKLNYEKLFSAKDKHLLRFQIDLKGRRYSKSVEVDEDFSATVNLPENLYSIDLSQQTSFSTSLLYSAQIPIKRGSKTQMDVHFLGMDHRKKKAQPYIYHEIQGSVLSGSKRKIFEGYQLNSRPDGIFEIYQLGQVFRRNSNNETELVFDWDFDGEIDSLDPDDDNDGIRDEIDRDDDNDGILDEDDDQDTDNDNDGLSNDSEVKDLILGNLQNPVIESFYIQNLTHPDLGIYGQAGDLIRLVAKCHSAGGSKVETVTVSLYRQGTNILNISLYDDGSEIDLNQRMQGGQISSDEKVGDEEFANILPLDLALFEYLYNTLWTIQAHSRLGKSSSKRIEIVYESLDQFLPQGNSNVLEKIQKIDMNFEYVEDSSQSKLNLGLVLTERLAVRLYFADQSYHLNGQKNPLKFYEYSDSLTVRPDTLLFLTVQDGSGGVFYFGHKL